MTRKFRSMDDIQAAMDSGEIRTFAQQSDDQQADIAKFGIDDHSKIRVASALEMEARRAYIGHIISHDNPRRLP
jgi:hypothetical protein